MIRRLKKLTADWCQKMFDEAGTAETVLLHRARKDARMNDFAVIHPSARERGLWQVTWLDEQMQPTGHFECRDRETALKTMCGEQTDEHGAPHGHAGSWEVLETRSAMELISRTEDYFWSS